jgi:hypothetical protein
MLETVGTDGAVLPPTELYNENWLLRVILDCFSRNRDACAPFRFTDGARWFSEALLPSAFLPRHQGDALAESWTHADGVIGHFRIGERGKGDLALAPSASQLVVLEGKVFSRLSSGVKNAAFFDQAARTVACIAEVLKGAECPPSSIGVLGFFVVAPNAQIEASIFPQVERESIRRKVERRVGQYSGRHDRWFEDWFAATLERIEIGCVSWEGAIQTLASTDPQAGEAIKDFYQKCLEFNAPRMRGG